MNNNIASYDQMFLCALSLDPLRAYNKEDIILQLPGEWTIFEIDWFSIFDVDSKENYGSVIIPDSLNVPPSLIKIVVCITIQWASIQFK
jgi:hypothetical protein